MAETHDAVWLYVYFLRKAPTVFHSEIAPFFLHQVLHISPALGVADSLLNLSRSNSPF